MMTRALGEKKSVRDSDLGSGSSSPAKEKTILNNKLPPSPASSSKTSFKSTTDASTTAPSNVLLICRNRHWQHITSYSGPWLQISTDMLGNIANINYNTPRPHPVDPAVVFDVFNIRKRVDEATAISVAAAQDLATATLVNVDAGPVNLRAFGQGTRLSKTRKLRMRELACQLLSRAYQFDEIACSVATMQSTSALDEVGGLVLQQKPDNRNAKYVHFFHEKIPSRQLGESTNLEPLDEIIASGHGQAEALRTRATIKNVRHEFESAVQDITEALSLSRHQSKFQSSDMNSAGPEQTQNRSASRNYNTMLPEQDQPSGLITQLLFKRASVYITMACQQVNDSLNPLTPRKGSTEGGNPSNSSEETGGLQAPSTAQLESRKLVKNLAKRALKDYIAFLSHFDYSPNLPLAGICEFNERVALVAGSKGKTPRSPEASSPTANHIVYPISRLFAAVPPPDLPPYPRQETEDERTGHHPRVSNSDPSTCELVTYHPILTEALHSLLICHCLIQTPVKELQRHAYMVARLIRLCDGYPLFQAIASPARKEWVEIIGHTKNWLPLSSSWETLCRPSLVYTKADNSLLPATTSPIRSSTPEASSSSDMKRTPPRKSSQKNSQGFPGSLASMKYSRSSFKYDSCPAFFPDDDDEKLEYPFRTQRPTTIVRWIREMPMITGTAKRKKRSKKTGAKVDTLEGDMEKLDMNE